MAHISLLLLLLQNLANLNVIFPLFFPTLFHHGLVGGGLSEMFSQVFSWPRLKPHLSTVALIAAFLLSFETIPCAHYRFQHLAVQGHSGKPLFLNISVIYTQHLVCLVPIIQ